MPVDGKFGHVTLERQPGVPVPDDIPRFVLLARDVSALGTILDYYHRAEANGTPPEGLDLIEEAFIRFTEWQQKNPDKMKIGSITMKKTNS